MDHNMTCIQIWGMTLRPVLQQAGLGHVPQKSNDYFNLGIQMFKSALFCSQLRAEQLCELGRADLQGVRNKEAVILTNFRTADRQSAPQKTSAVSNSRRTYTQRFSQLCCSIGIAQQC